MRLPMDKSMLRPYLVVPKLIEQPTWGGSYIVETKQWQAKPELKEKKIGQSYELYDKSNLSLSVTSVDPQFVGEIADIKMAQQQTAIPNAVALAELIATDASAVLGKRMANQYGNAMHLLLKFTQALGNSFQLHIPDGVTHPRWKAKPESWYYFEPGLITCGVKKGTDWQTYQAAVTELDNKMQHIAPQVRDGSLPYGKAQEMIAALLKQYDPWQYVNLVRVKKGTLLDLSPCGIHHSWEEDLKTIPLGNVLYEIQLNVMDDVATLRSFDKGKMSKEGTLRPLQIDEYFTYADRSEQANDPDTHMRTSTLVSDTPRSRHERLLKTTYYSMDRITMAAGGSFHESIDTFRHLFIRSGAVDITAGTVTVHVTRGHSVFVPAACGAYDLRSADNGTEVLLSY